MTRTMTMMMMMMMIMTTIDIVPTAEGKTITWTTTVFCWLVA